MKAFWCFSFVVGLEHLSLMRHVSLRMILRLVLLGIADL